MFLFTCLIEQVEDRLEGDSAVAAQADLAGAGGGVAFGARGGLGAVCKGAFYLGAEHSQTVSVQLREGEASVSGKAAAVAVNYCYFFGA